MERIKISYWKSPLGELIIGIYDGMLCLCDWNHRKQRAALDLKIQRILKSSYHVQDDPLADRTIKQLTEYFEGKREEFDIPMAFVGTKFQTSVWNALLDVDYGKTESYLDLSLRIGNKKAIRAVASANGANSISILVPCHRIIGSKGELTGYAGGLEAKKALLKMEGVILGNQMSLF